ncbi:hypothetical protein HK102_010614, partial [Quaeritorhiza haematococci]
SKPAQSAPQPLHLIPPVTSNPVPRTQPQIHPMPPFASTSNSTYKGEASPASATVRPPSSVLPPPIWTRSPYKEQIMEEGKFRRRVAIKYDF